jgi:hypothetical protein
VNLNEVLTAGLVDKLFKAMGKQTIKLVGKQGLTLPHSQSYQIDCLCVKSYFPFGGLALK